jgi:hypothetical protein
MDRLGRKLAMIHLPLLMRICKHPLHPTKLLLRKLEKSGAFSKHKLKFILALKLKTRPRLKLKPKQRKR